MTMPTTMLSPNFTLDEFLISQTASREGIDNTPDDEAYLNLKRTALVMEKVRTMMGDRPILISSGYRSPALNIAVGGSATSAHCFGLAADFTSPAAGTPLDICRVLAEYIDVLELDQLIYEYEAWVHLGLSVGPPRYQILTIDNAGTRSGLP
jgi:hypothetical protein